MLQGYRTSEDALRTVRGRIRIGEQIARRPGPLVPIEATYDKCTMNTYDECTMNIAEKQILRTAVRRMPAIPLRGPAVGTRLAHLDGRLAQVSVLAAGAPTPDWQPTRLNERCNSACRARTTE
ncbi:MAG: hypothetical protein H6525_06540 [Actinobacteria bacterium]|nr:hypothetical protein [Actinomycetota bacterium]MCB9412488.1 hypothetical protein [Actinomycetota bacterium]